jgi:membrane protease YdiL (CAAX protease family)
MPNLARPTWPWLACSLLLAALAGIAAAVYVNQPLNRGFLVWCLITGAAVPLLARALTTSTIELTGTTIDTIQQVRRVAGYVVVLVACNMLVAPLYLSDSTSRKVHYVVAAAVYLVTWAALPLVFLRVRYWRWPEVSNPDLRPRESLAIAVTCTYALLCTWANTDAAYVDVDLAEFLLAVPYIAISAFSEELVFRVMLLSYLVSALKAPLPALVLSSAAFGFLHVPFNAVNEQALMLDLGNPHITALPLMQTAMGLLFGTLWMRTRSLLAVGGAHTLVNLTPGLAEFSTVWN